MLITYLENQYLNKKMKNFRINNIFQRIFLRFGILDIAMTATMK